MVPLVDSHIRFVLLSHLAFRMSDQELERARLGEGETGAQAAVPIFIDFMKVALKDKPPLPFVPPKNAKFGMVNGVREAFRPGTEVRAPDALPTGPIPYNQLNAAPAAAAPAVEAPPAVVRQADPIGALY